MKDHHHNTPENYPEVRRLPRGGEQGRANRAPIEQERPIRITAEQVQRSLRDTQRARSRRQFRKKLPTVRKPALDGAREGLSVEGFRNRFWLSAGLTIPTLIWGELLPGILGFSPPAVVGAQWIPALGATAVFAYGGWPFLNGASRELRRRLPGTMTLVALAISVAFGFSLAVELGFSGSALWEQLATLVVVLLFGRWIEMRATSPAKGASNGMTTSAHQSRSQAQSIADRSAAIFTVGAIAAGIATGVWWLVVQRADASFAVERLVTVLVISGPHVLGVAVPLILGISTAVGARNGLIIRDLDKTRRLTTVVFDKAGSLTLGEPRVVDIATIEGLEADDALRLAAAVERDSPHPIAQAIRKSATDRGLQIPSATDFQLLTGHGVKAVFDGREFAVGGPNLLQALNADPDHSLAGEEISASARGQQLIYLIEDTRVIAAFAIADAIRPESQEAVKRLRRLGIEVAMMTSDSSSVARSMAKQLGIQRVLAQVLPEEKTRRVEELRATGKRVALVGNGITDSNALAVADVGIAIGAGTPVAVEAADVILVRSDPRDVSRAVKLARVTHRKFRQTFSWVAGYNIVAIPLAAGALAALGIIVSPALGAVLMSVSALVVAVNARLLRRVKL